LNTVNALADARFENSDLSDFNAKAAFGTFAQLVSYHASPKGGG
jgi:hypothetical protein